jgi:azurin
MDETKLKVSMYSQDQVQFETNTKLVEANCKQAWMKLDETSMHPKAN